MGDLVSGFAGMKQGKQQAYEYELQSKHAEVEALAAESDRKYRLLEALASQNASAGARNLVAFEGSPMAVMQQDISMEKEATQRGEFSLRLAQRMNRLRGKWAKMSGYYGLIASGMKTGEKIAGVMMASGGAGGGGGSSMGTPGASGASHRYSNYNTVA